MIRMRAAAAVLVLGLWFSATVTSQGGQPRAHPAGNGAFAFGLIGDMPYGPEGELKFPTVIADNNQHRTLAFV